MVLTRHNKAAERILQMVESVCPFCLQRISGRLIEAGEEVILEKTCPVHGACSCVIWRGEPEYSSWFRPKIPFLGGSRQALDGRGCPYECGLCENHRQRTCTALVEITSRCNLNCPVCFADSTGAGIDPDAEGLDQIFAMVMEKTGGCNLQLSGGEPTVRDDLVEIVAMARRNGFSFIQLNSNGLRLAAEPEFSFELKEAGLSSVFLQFDGVDDSIFSALRGRSLFEEKQRAIENLARVGIGIVLVPTLVHGVNEDCLWDIVRFGLCRQPQIRGVHFQPMSYFGRFPVDFVPRHVTLPEVMGGLVAQSDGVIKLSDFKPPGCEHALCSFSARYITLEDGTLLRLGREGCDCTPKPAEQGAVQSIGVTARQWGDGWKEDSCKSSADDLDRFLARARSHTFSISGMAFQDCWSMNLERLQGCCIHLATGDGRLVPFCSYNLTAVDGHALHRGRGNLR